MPRPVEPRRGLAYHRRGHHQAFRDADGVGQHVPHVGEVVFAQLSYEWKIKRQLLKGSAPARLLRFFMWDDEEDASQGEKRLMYRAA